MTSGDATTLPPTPAPSPAQEPVEPAPAPPPGERIVKEPGGSVPNRTLNIRDGSDSPLDLAAVALPPAPAATPVVDLGAVALPAQRVGFVAWLGQGWTFLCGAVGLVLGLSVIAAIPVLQLATLGWFLEAEGRIGRTGSARGALPGVDTAARLGAALLGLLLVSLPWLVLNGYLQDARLLDPSSDVTRGLTRATWLVGVASAAHAGVALARGGRFLFFVRPLSNWLWAVRAIAAGPALEPTWRRAVASVQGLRVPHYLGLGAQGLVAGFAWLALPTALLALGGANPLLALLGALLLVVILPWLLAAQARLASEGRFGAAFELREVRRRIARAPLANAVALVLVLGLALPLYLLKIEPVPRDALWLPAVFFIVAALPGRVASGWAYARGAREGRAHPLLRVLGLAVALPAAGAYVFVLVFSQLFSWYGGVSLFAHHAFLLPVAFY